MREWNLDGVEVRYANYDDYEALEKAFADAEKVVLVSTNEMWNAQTQHGNVIRAAKAKGVKQVLDTGIQDMGAQHFRISYVADTNEETEKALKESGLAYTLMLNGIYMESGGFCEVPRDECGPTSAATRGTSLKPPDSLLSNQHRLLGEDTRHRTLR